MTYGKKFFILLLVLMVFQSIYYYGQLPDRIATHFDASGDPNGWSSKQFFFAMYLALVGLLASVFFLLPEVLHRLPPGAISLPNRDYWLAPERKERTIQHIKKQMLYMGNGTLIFLVVVFQCVIDANLREEPHLAPGLMWLVIGGYPVFAIAWTVRILVRFSRREAEDEG